MACKGLETFESASFRYTLMMYLGLSRFFDPDWIDIPNREVTVSWSRRTRYV